MAVGPRVLSDRSGDLDIAVFGQLAATNLPFRDKFEPGPVKMIGFEASFRRRGLWKKDLEHAPGNPHHALMVADPDAELDGVPSGFHRTSGGKRKNMYLMECSASVLSEVPPIHRRCRVFYSAAMAQLRGEHLTVDPRLEVL
jgi:hypothetical protein